MPILKRNDLSKQFELVVQQEIKNHNDQMLATNLSINELREEIRKNKDKQDSINAQIDSKIVEMKWYSSNLNDFSIRLAEKMNCLCDELNSKIEKMKHEYQVSDNNAIAANSKCEFLSNQVTSLWADLEDLKDGLMAVSYDLTQELEKQIREVNKSIEKAKQDILSAPSEAQQVKKELDEKMSIDRVDFCGVMKELQIIKKENFISQKKFENIYTLIDRIKSCHKQG